jgi:hypothetical protein
MILHIFHTITGVAVVFLMVGKLIIHYYLDHLHQRDISFNTLLVMPLQYLRPYKFQVKKEGLKWRRICNLFLKLAILAFVLNIMIGLMIYFT